MRDIDRSSLAVAHLLGRLEHSLGMDGSFADGSGGQDAGLTAGDRSHDAMHNGAHHGISGRHQMHAVEFVLGT